MDSFEINKFVGALLATILVVFGVNMVGGAIFHSDTPEKPGYAVEGAEDSSANDDGHKTDDKAGSEDTTPKDEAAPKKTDGEDPAKKVVATDGTADTNADTKPADPASGASAIAALVAAADVAKGEKVFKKCKACHTSENGGKNKVGPNLWNIVNRPIAKAENYRYSSALTEFAADKTWTYDHLDGFLTKPADYVGKSKMTFALKKPKDRAAVIAYLRTLSDSPAPLPAE